MTSTVYANKTAILNNIRGGFLLALFFAVSCMITTPAMADQAQVDKAVASYIGTTLPAIAKMKPLIGKSAPARAKAFAKMGISEGHCSGAETDALYAHQKLAEGASELCEALIGWMDNEEIMACYGAYLSSREVADTRYPHDAVISKRHKSENVEKALQGLQASAGCAKKDARYWGAKALDRYDLLSAHITDSGELIAASLDSQIPTLEMVKQHQERCFEAAYLANKESVGTMGGMYYGCLALGYLADKDFDYSCKRFNDGLKAISDNPDMAYFVQTGPALKSRLTDRLIAPVCAPTLAKLLQDKADKDNASAEKARLAAAAAPPQPSGPTQTQQANALIGIINGEQQSYNTNLQYAKNWDDRGETKLACGYTQKALNNLSVLQDTYGKLGDVMRTTEHREEIARLKKIQSDYYTSEWESCKEAGYLLAN